MYYTFNYETYVYISLDIRDISRFSYCTKLSQCREQEGSATLVIVTLHLLSTLPIYKMNDIPLMISSLLYPLIQSLFFIAELASLVQSLSFFFQRREKRINSKLAAGSAIKNGRCRPVLSRCPYVPYCQTPHSCSSFSSFVHHYFHLPNDEGTCQKGKFRNVAYNNIVED